MTDTELALMRVAYLASKYFGIWLDPIKRIIYHDEFEDMTEYNGFLVEV